MTIGYLGIEPAVIAKSRTLGHRLGRFETPPPGDFRVATCERCGYRAGYFFRATDPMSTLKGSALDTPCLASPGRSRGRSTVGTRG